MAQVDFISLSRVLSYTRNFIDTFWPGIAPKYFIGGEKLYYFWSAVNQLNSVDEIDKKLRFATASNASWGWASDTNVLFKRDCYVEAVDIILSSPSYGPFIVQGTPGIGNSMFIFYFIYEIVRREITAGKPAPTFLISGHQTPTEQYYLGFEADGAPIVHRYPSSLPDYLITDTVANASPKFSKKYIHVSGTRNVNMTEIKKLLIHGTPGRVVLMPVFSLDEYLECERVCGAVRDDETLRFAFGVFGGSLRNCRLLLNSFSSSTVTNNICTDSMRTLVEGQMRSFFGEANQAGVDQELWTTTRNVVASLLMSTEDQEPHQLHGVIRSVLLHAMPIEDDPGCFEILPASRFMRHLIGHICDDTRSGNDLARLRAILRESGIEYVHEHDAHEYRLANLQAPGITLCSLDEHNKSMRLCLPAMKRVVRIRTVDDIRRLQPGEYGLPTNTSNFPAIDAVIKPNLLFQDTILAEQHDYDVAKLKEIVEAMTAVDFHVPQRSNRSASHNIMLIKSLATSNFDAFRNTTKEELKVFSQWKLRVEAHEYMTEDSEEATRKKRPSSSADTQVRKRARM